MKKELLESCAAMYRTPAYIFDTDCFRQTIRNLRDSFGKDVGLCYAMKANPFLADRAEKEADRIEICSMRISDLPRETDRAEEDADLRGDEKPGGPG